MVKRPKPPQKISRWRISRIKSTPAVEIGYVEAADAEQAIKTAIERYGMTNPVHQQRLSEHL
jgi:hypothetical protein